MLEAMEAKPNDKVSGQRQAAQKSRMGLPTTEPKSRIDNDKVAILPFASVRPPPNPPKQASLWPLPEASRRRDKLGLLTCLRPFVVA